ncbi:MAG: hypothetical protein FWC83_01510, partial [Alphaproteobacteria bacterium]|nr:hypothetical protein [Alphaproteobacteria bacterium]
WFEMPDGRKLNYHESLPRRHHYLCLRNEDMVFPCDERYYRIEKSKSEPQTPHAVPAMPDVVDDNFLDRPHESPLEHAARMHRNSGPQCAKKINPAYFEDNVGPDDFPAYFWKYHGELFPSPDGLDEYIEKIVSGKYWESHDDVFSGNAEQRIEKAHEVKTTIDVFNLPRNKCFGRIFNMEIVEAQDHLYKVETYGARKGAWYLGIDKVIAGNTPPFKDKYICSCDMRLDCPNRYFGVIEGNTITAPDGTVSTDWGRWGGGKMPDAGWCSRDSGRQNFGEVCKGDRFIIANDRLASEYSNRQR